MKLSHKIAKILDRILLTVTGYIVVFLLLCSGYIIYDTLYTGRAAFTSYDLLQYKPAVQDNANTLNGFEDLLALNSDAVGWLTIYDTNIDYPVVQGKDNFEYANKSVYGVSSLTGAIYLDSEENGFSDWYSMIYGHHMANGAMFGDIDNYQKESYLKSHNDGYLQTLDGNYRLTIFACVKTNAYEKLIYNMTDDVRNPDALWEYIKENSLSVLPEFSEGGAEQFHKVIAMSTCESSATNGRLVLFADAVQGNGRAKQQEKPTVLTAIGHMSDNTHWALLNLACVFITLVIWLPLLWTDIKYRQFFVACKTSKRYKNLLKDEQYTRQERKQFQRIARDMDDFKKFALIGFAGELFFLLISVLLFLQNENITRPMVMCDEWTIVMFILMLYSFAVDFMCFRYRGRLPEQDTDNDKS